MKTQRNVPEEKHWSTSDGGRKEKGGCDRDHDPKW